MHGTAKHVYTLLMAQRLISTGAAHVVVQGNELKVSSLVLAN